MHSSPKTLACSSLAIVALVSALIHLFARSAGPWSEQSAPNAAPSPPPTAEAELEVEGDCALAVEACAFDAVACFWRYVDGLRAIEDPERRRDELSRPARAVLEFSEARRCALGVLDTEGFTFEIAIGRTRLESLLRDSLMERWLECAGRAGHRERLREAALVLFGRETAGGLAAADLALLELACSCVGSFVEQEDLQRLLPRILPLLEAELDEPDLEEQRVFPVLALLAPAGRFGWARADLLALLGRPWLRSGPRSFFFFAVTTASGLFADWEESIIELCNSPSPALQWAAIEALRGFASRRGPRGEPGVQPERIVALIPVAAYCADDVSLRRAALDLAAGFGGDPGRELLRELLLDPTAPQADIRAALAR